MWWRRDAALGLAALALAVAATGCGFRPLYGGAAGERIQRALAGVEILPIDGPLGVELRNHLLDYLAPASLHEGLLYELSVQVDFASDAQVTERDTQIRRYIVRMNASYALRAKEDGSVLKTGNEFTETSYNIVERENYSTLVAEQSAKDEAARDISRAIVSRLALYFDRKAAP